MVPALGLTVRILSPVAPGDSVTLGSQTLGNQLFGTTRIEVKVTCRPNA
jgi:hypothetical protein